MREDITKRLWNLFVNHFAGTCVHIIFFNHEAYTIWYAQLVPTATTEYVSYTTNNKIVNNVFGGATHYGPLKAALDKVLKQLSTSQKSYKVYMVTDGKFNGGLGGYNPKEMLHSDVWFNALMIRLHTSDRGEPDTSKLIHISTMGYLWNLINIKRNTSDAYIIDALTQFKNSPIVGSQEIGQLVNATLMGDNVAFNNWPLGRLTGDALTVLGDRLASLTLLPLFDKSTLSKFLRQVLQLPQNNRPRNALLRQNINLTGTETEETLSNLKLQTLDLNTHLDSTKPGPPSPPSPQVTVMPWIQCENGRFRIAASSVQGDFTKPLPCFATVTPTPDKRALEVNYCITSIPQTDVFIQLEFMSLDGKITIQYLTTTSISIDLIDTVAFQTSAGGIYSGVRGDLKIAKDPAIVEFTRQFRLENFQQTFLVLMQNAAKPIHGALTIQEIATRQARVERAKRPQMGDWDMAPKRRQQQRERGDWDMAPEEELTRLCSATRSYACSRREASDDEDSNRCGERVAESRQTVVMTTSSTTRSSHNQALQNAVLTNALAIFVNVTVGGVIPESNIHQFLGCAPLQTNLERHSCPSNEPIPIVGPRSPLDGGKPNMIEINGVLVTIPNGSTLHFG
jgi:hypothetical protein